MSTVCPSLNTAFEVRGILDGRNAPYEEVKVDADTIDSILSDMNIVNLNIIKIDAESSEEFVLQGLKNTLSTFHPIILIELGGCLSDDEIRIGLILKILKECEYDIFVYRDGNLQLLESTENLPYDNYVLLYVGAPQRASLGRFT